MSVTIILCAILCAAACLYMLKPIHEPRRFIRVAVTTALVALGLYMVLGNPEIPAHPTPVNSERAGDMRLESELMAAVETNPQDADAMIRLAALRASQGRVSDETIELLDRAEKIKPGDRRIRLIRAMTGTPED